MQNLLWDLSLLRGVSGKLSTFWLTLDIHGNKKLHDLNRVKRMEIKFDNEIKDVVDPCNKGSSGYFESNKQVRFT